MFTGFPLSTVSEIKAARNKLFKSEFRMAREIDISEKHKMTSDAVPNQNAALSGDVQFINNSKRFKSP